MSAVLPDRPLSQQLREALAWVDELGAAADCQLIVDSGTLLGLVRDAAPLPGDLDLDLSLADESAVDRLTATLHRRGAKIWRYAGKPYRAEIAAERTGLPLAVEVKFFQRDGDAYVCPAVGYMTPGSGKTTSGGLRSLLRPLWRKMLAAGDAARFPMKHFARVDAWRVPAAYFDDRVALPGWSHCATPSDVDAYLTYRYGDWRHPVTDWVTWRDDGAYHAASTAMRAAQAGSPHRRT